MFQNQRGFAVRSAELAQPVSRSGGLVQVEYWTSRVIGYGVLLGTIVLGGFVLLG